VRALHFGVAAHHGGLPIKYRRAVEALFRAGHVRAIFATGTLAQVRCNARTGRYWTRRFSALGNVLLWAFQLDKALRMDTIERAFELAIERAWA
jgi:hypothetical protein